MSQVLNFFFQFEYILLVVNSAFCQKLTLNFLNFSWICLFVNYVQHLVHLRHNRALACLEILSKPTQEYFNQFIAVLLHELVHWDLAGHLVKINIENFNFFT